METMGSLSHKLSQLFDPVRKKWVKETPEELIRQGWIRKMTAELGFPLAQICVEKEIASLPHHAPGTKNIPLRRIDILAFTNRGSSLVPLLMIECKMAPLTQKFAEQVIGYNDYVGAPFIAIANADQILTGRFDFQKKEFIFQTGLANYSELVSHI